MNKEARELAYSIRNKGFKSATAIVTSNAIWFTMMKKLISIVGLEKIPRESIMKEESYYLAAQKAC